MTYKSELPHYNVFFFQVIAEPEIVWKVGILYDIKYRKLIHQSIRLLLEKYLKNLKVYSLCLADAIGLTMIRVIVQSICPNWTTIERVEAIQRITSETPQSPLLKYLV